MDRVLSINSDSVTAEAGALYVDVAEELEKLGLQFHVNTEIGNLSLGSAACAGTKDASMPGEFGQVHSYVTGVKMVLPSGQLLEVDDRQPEMMRMVRSSYGLLGIIYEVTLRVRPIQNLAVYHQTFSLKDFVQQLPDLVKRNESIMMYLFPFEDVITVEFRKYVPGDAAGPDRHVWGLRNLMWKTVGPRFCHEVTNDIEDPKLRYAVIDNFNYGMRLSLEHLSSDRTRAADQIIRYPAVSDSGRYTFSLWAFPEERYPRVLQEYFEFCREYYEQTGYRCNTLNVGYRIAKDASALFSYSIDGTVMTLDPVSTGNPGWYEFLDAYNEFSSSRGGIPLFNQTLGISRAQAAKAFGNRLTEFENERRRCDPDGRFLNPDFRELLSEG
jgi:FAD/FMN-containing dehydrogenase